MVIPELEDLFLPPYLAGERVPITRGGLEFFTPDGERLIGDEVSAWTNIMACKQQDPTCDNRTDLMIEGGLVTVSTVYLGRNRGWPPGGPALFWESTVTLTRPGDEYGLDYRWRYGTRAAAISGHHRVVRILEDFFGVPPLGPLPPIGKDRT